MCRSCWSWPAKDLQNVTDIYHSWYLCDPQRVDKTKLTKTYISQLFRMKHPCGWCGVLMFVWSHISAVGTFSWWSAWLIGGNVTYYKWSTKEGTPIRQHFSKDYTDCVYPHWVGLWIVNCGNLNLCYGKCSFIIIRYLRIRNVANLG